MPGRKGRCTDYASDSRTLAGGPDFLSGLFRRLFRGLIDWLLEFFCRNSLRQIQHRVFAAARAHHEYTDTPDYADKTDAEVKE